MNVREALGAYFIMGSNNANLDPLFVLEQALKGGITLFQFREKGANAKVGDEKVKLAKDMQQLCKQYNVPFIVNDDVNLAINIHADGVHVGQDDESAVNIKKNCPSHFIVGVSATNLAEAKQAVIDGADYIGVGPIFATNTKEDAKAPIGLDGITEIRDAVGDIPMVAIGGIKHEHTPGIIKAGADGVSVISAISQAESPLVAARDIRELVDQHKSV
ncbi:thiamine phosphate synthase [Aquibacillus koreensis]|uniref:Thiamine-phosphate synthase n=1 Tax=Aquibacillus koreensis TaxID=279446 RepID=A0A9X3WR38_9BACI|nr:thiamine phosphate synthase [Aquibacillus koreensis]MCT2536207.1 thiamine phosphate synthase [Aquibacillus koreensis]MDC3422131.1 thiamine phosphate synthase [Aquibacillus koreensis]